MFAANLETCCLETGLICNSAGSLLPLALRSEQMKPTTWSSGSTPTPLQLSPLHQTVASEHPGRSGGWEASVTRSL